MLAAKRFSKRIGSKPFTVEYEVDESAVDTNLAIERAEFATLAKRLFIDGRQYTVNSSLPIRFANITPTIDAITILTFPATSPSGVTSNFFSGVTLFGLVFELSGAQSAPPQFGLALARNGTSTSATSPYVTIMASGSPVTSTTTPAPGSSQFSPFLPSSQLPGGGFVFINVPSGSWVDPPLVSGFHYEMTTPGSLFTGITGFPIGFSDPFTVFANGSFLGQFLPGQTLTFPGSGITSFDITGINPLSDASNPTAFPLQLTFSTPTASFTMQGIEPVPEPASLLTWLTLPLLALAARIRLQIGDQVKIIRGALAGIIGRVVGHSDSGRWVPAIDGLPQSVTVVIAADALECHGEPLEACRAGRSSLVDG